MNEKLKSAARHYLWGLLATAWNGGIGAVAGIAGIGAVSMSGVEGVHVLNGREMASAFLGAFVWSGIMWLKTHPVPVEMPETKPPFETK